MRKHVVYILDLSMTLTFDLYVGGGGIRSEFHSQFLSCLFMILMDEKKVHVLVNKFVWCQNILNSILELMYYHGTQNLFSKIIIYSS